MKQNIVLRKLELKDTDGMLEWMNDQESREFFRFPSDYAKPANVIKFIESANIEPVENESIHYAIVNEKDEYLGTISLKNIDMKVKKAEYAIALRKTARSKGVGTRATKLILDKAFNKIGLNKVYLNVLSNNKRAIVLYEKVGFVFEGEFRQDIYINGKIQSLRWYSILKEEYIK